MRDLNNLNKEHDKKLKKNKGEYFVALDKETELYCIFHTDKSQGKVFEVCASEEEAERVAKEMNTKIKE